MSESQKPLVIVFLGSIGVGKSYFASRLSSATKTVRINSDAMREAIDEEWGDKGNARVWGAIDYTVKQLLAAEKNVIYDAARMNVAESRKKFTQMVQDAGGQVLIVWIETSREVASERVVTREPRSDQLQFTPDQVEAILTRHDTTFTPPQEGELSIKIDGTAPFDDQYQSFTEQIEQVGISL